MGKKNKTKAALNSSAAETSLVQESIVIKPTKQVLDEQPHTSGLVASKQPFEIPFQSRSTAFALLWLLFYARVYSSFIFTTSFVAFYGVKHILVVRFHAEDFSITCGSVLAAILTVNVIIILRALQESREDEKERRRNAVPDAASGDESKRII